MEHLNKGVATLFLRAETWECDFNGHWNTRYYCNAFQNAASVAATLGDVRMSLEKRQMRFHSELKGGYPIIIRSFNTTTQTGEPVIAHIMLRYGRLVATAVDYGSPINPALSHLTTDEATLALPRGITTPDIAPWDPIAKGSPIYELGPVIAEDLSPEGELHFWQGVTRLAQASHHHDLDLGFTLELMEQDHIGRMLAEMRYTKLGSVQAGDFLRIASHMYHAKGKAFYTAHMLYTHRGAPVAMFDLCTLAVDMQARRATDLPDFVFARLSEH